MNYEIRSKKKKQKHIFKKWISLCQYGKLKVLFHLTIRFYSIFDYNILYYITTPYYYSYNIYSLQPTENHNSVFLTKENSGLQVYLNQQVSRGRLCPLVLPQVLVYTVYVAYYTLKYNLVSTLSIKRKDFMREYFRRSKYSVLIYRLNIYI